jgi:hypothetical protein
MYVYLLSERAAKPVSPLAEQGSLQLPETGQPDFNYEYQFVCRLD